MAPTANSVDGESVEPAFILVHSLLLRPSTWAPVAAKLAALGAATVVPSLVDVADADPPFWPRITTKIRNSASHLSQQRPLVLVAHSNAGLFVPVIVQAMRRPVAGCVFVEARLPCRTGSTPAASPQRLAVLRAKAVEGKLPPWTAWWDEDDVASLFPDTPTRLAVSAEQPRLPLSFYQQRIPVPAGWDDRPCGYLWFGPPYDRMARQAHQRGWDVDHVPGRHLHQLVDPDTVTARVIGMAGSWGTT